MSCVFVSILSCCVLFSGDDIPPAQKPTFVFLQSLLSGLKHRLVELLGKFLRGETVPGFGASIGGVKALFSLQGVWGPQAVQQAGALLGD